MKSTSKLKKKKKASPQSSNLCQYYFKLGHPEEKCYYKYLERASKDFRQRFKNHIQEFESKTNTIWTQGSQDKEKQSEINRIYVVQSKGTIMATGKLDPDWYFYNAASYHMTDNLDDFEDSATLTKYCHPEDNIILANGSVILPNRIGTISLKFCIKGTIEKIPLLGIQYCSKFDIKLISLGILDWKDLSYSLYKG